jgi:hypothetical protein
MAKATYSRTSPYYDTPTFGNFLDVMTYRAIPAKSTDTYYEIDSVYSRRPDLLASDLYGDSNLWWVFIVRNPNVLKDPIFDFTAGTRIYIPQKETISAALGI